MRFLAGIALGCALLPAGVRAGVPEGKIEIGILAGASLLDVESEFPGPIPARGVPIPEPFEFRLRSDLGGSFIQGFRIGRYMNRRAQVELSLLIAPTHDVERVSFFVCSSERICPRGGQGGGAIPFFQFTETVVAYHYALNFTYDLGQGEFRPFASFGVGGVSYDLPENVETDFALNLGGGAKIYFGRVGVRIEVVDHILPDHFLTGKTEHDIHVRGGFLFRLP